MISDDTLSTSPPVPISPVEDPTVVAEPPAAGTAATESPNAGGLTSLLKGVDVPKITSQLESSIKEHPMLWAGGALLAGLVLGQALAGRKNEGTTASATEANEGEKAQSFETSLDSALKPLTETLKQAAEQVRPQVKQFAEKNLASLLQNAGVAAPHTSSPKDPSGNA